MKTGSGVEVVPVVTSDQLAAFIRLPWAIYRNDPNWAPPLIRDVKTAFNPSKHPFHAHSEVQPFLSLRDGKPVGRIAAVRNRNHERFHEEPVGFFGYYECVDDPDASRALFDATASWLSERGLKTMRGPTSFSTNEVTGLLVDGVEGLPVLMMAYNPPYYVDQIEAYGFQTAKTLLAYMIDDQTQPEHLHRASRIVRRRAGVTMRTMNMKKFDSELALVRKIYNSAWEKNWGFVPMTDAEFAFMAKELKPIIDPSIAVFADTSDGETIAFALALPDFNIVLRKMNGRLLPFGLLKALWYGRKIHRARVLTLGVAEGYRGKGIDAALILELYRNGTARGINQAELSWVLEDNEKMRAALERLGARAYRRYRLYDADL